MQSKTQWSLELYIVNGVESGPYLIAIFYPWWKNRNSYDYESHLLIQFARVRFVLPNAMSAKPSSVTLHAILIVPLRHCPVSTVIANVCVQWNWN